MKRYLFIIMGMIYCTAFSAQEKDSVSLHTEIDSLSENQFVMRSTLYGIGYTNILDTYLSPMEYTGVEGRILHERMRMTKLFDGNVSTQSMLQANIAYTENKSATGNEISGLVNWNYGLHYHFKLNEHLRILTGALGEINGGFIYNTRNSNNPAQAKAYINVSASAMAIYKFRIKNIPFQIRYQVNVPFIGVMFSPNYQQSYYEIFTLRNHHGIVNFTSLHNQPSLRQFLTLDIPVSWSTLRIGYVGDFQQSKVNNIRCHTYSNVFMIGFVKNFYLIKNKDKIQKKIPF